MLTPLFRRALAAIASLLLVLGLVVLTSSPSEAEDPAGKYRVTGTVNVASIAVRFYRSTTGDEAGPWELSETTTTNATQSPTASIGDYSAWLEPGTYRITFNEFDDGTLNWKVYAPYDWVDSSDYYSSDTTFTITDSGRYFGANYLPKRAGYIHGSYSDICSNYFEPVTIEAYAADDPDPAHASIWRSYWGNEYSGWAFEGPTKFKIVWPVHASQWLGGDSFDTATAFTIPKGDNTFGPDIFLQQDFDATANGEIRGGVGPESGAEDIAGLVVRFYRSESGGNDGPWVPAGQTTTSDGANWANDGLSKGDYQKSLPSGVYRVTVNDSPDTSLVSRSYTSGTYRGTDLASGGNVCVDSRIDGRIDEMRVRPAGGTITGQVTDGRGNPIADTTVDLVDGSDSASDNDPVIRSVNTRSDGTYSIRSVEGPVKLRFTPENVTVAGNEVPQFVGEWSGDAPDFAHAIATEATLGQTTSGVDATLTDAPLVAGLGPYIHGKPLVGTRMTATGIATNHSDIPPSYQWLRTKSGKTVSITGATKYSYLLTAKDAGARVSVRVTINPPATFPGLTPVSNISARSDVVKSKSHVVARARALGGRRFKITFSVSVVGVSKPDGRVYVSWVRLRQKGSYLYPTGTTTSRWVSYRDGHGSYTVKVSRKAYWAYRVYQPTTSTIISHQASHALYVK
ncbi:hypothetical protein ASC61_06540 [Aeromicrobium sp. Root344]|uniref:carboxypeptidase-like regulatory domain-containing protein n=1 Tax=Aeromicrobium sp. Root344 TaxID=1736521 RepID=UPI0006FF7E10|nr:carboxypeptidase-like regulatory domain-containing protein [Aeromicrobium sp. Root344]KQV74686.1 hypothetical protein ASC61_06540 [Aeromicrobium sp. Root344]